MGLGFVLAPQVSDLEKRRSQSLTKASQACRDYLLMEAALLESTTDPLVLQGVWGRVTQFVADRSEFVNNPLEDGGGQAFRRMAELYSSRTTAAAAPGPVLDVREPSAVVQQVPLLE